MLKQSEVLKLLREGKSVKEIAQITNSKVSNVKAHRKRIIKSGLWHSQEAGLQWNLDLDQVTDILIDRLEKAKMVPELESKIKLLENQKAAIENELIVLRQSVQEKSERERRFKLAVQQGLTKPL